MKDSRPQGQLRIRLHPPRPNGRHANSSLMINALIYLFFLLAITIPPAAAVTAQLQHAKSNYHDPATQALEGLAGYTRNYYGIAALPGESLVDVDSSSLGPGLNLATATYANYGGHTNGGHRGGLGSSTSGFEEEEKQLYHNRPHELEYDAGGIDGSRQSSKIDFVINTANYESEAGADAGAVAAYDYDALRAPTYAPAYPNPNHLRSSLLPDYHIEQFSNYRLLDENLEQEQREQQQQKRSEREESAALYSNIRQRNGLVSHSQREQPEPERLPPHYYSQSAQDQQHLYSHYQAQLADNNNNKLPAITTSVHHTPESSKAIAGQPLAKHIEITKHVPITHYQKQHVPYKQTVQVPVPRNVITTVPRPVPIKVPVTKTIAMPMLQEVKVPIEKVRTVPVERPVPFVVERRVPYRVEKPVAISVPYPYPIKVPVVRTIVHKHLPAHSSLPARPHFVWPGAGPAQGVGIGSAWSSAKNLLG
ncbi:uncharacterized protein LOC115620294 [Scaptodrosophila lebanonensis]|uniref:Uncharacterized protein LOC115620294 n=1 Tax=Drosophila lebanonensis TaxID=7225 RepID=A0A6J2T258_DROLE|nr:uncharacterized protein LOC115620294 [Scaptodrosophila lebanonensis]